ncbi:hypothetical protein [Ruminococcus sp. 5_1_39BFAA]|uniref:hypothetical protein n=1 Tax=Ruminococcus sp. 5_1_39BFAA TaxID=457412 RepID=UPI003563CA3B
MPVVKSMAQLKSLLQRQMVKAMQEVQKEAYKRTKDDVQDFYSGGSPVVYQRTGALGNTPQFTPLKSSGNSASFSIYLDQSHNYSTGRDLVSMSALLPVAESGGYGILGKPGFWQKSEADIEEVLNSVMSKYFN